MRNFTHFKFLALLTTLFTFSWSISSFGQGSGTQDDPYIMVGGEEYVFNVYKDFYGKFIVPEDVTKEGIVLEVVSDNWIDIFSDEARTMLVSKTSGNYAPYTTTLKMAVGTKKGTTYYLYSDFPMNSGTAKVSYGAERAIELVSVTPAQGNTLSASECFISYIFSKPIRIDQCEMVIGDVTTVVEANIIDRFVSVEPKDELLEAYKSDILKKGDNISFILKNVCTQDGSNNIGDVKIDYIAAEKPLLLASSVNTPETGMPAIKSWMPTNKNKGVIQLTFDGKLNKETPLTATLSYGNKESGTTDEYYVEELTPRITNDNTIEIDVRGKLRIPSQMIVSGTVYDNILLTVRGVKDEDGFSSYTEGGGASGVYFITYAFEIINYSMMTEFIPSSGSNIDNFDEITIWIQETGGNLTYTGAVFDYVCDNEQKQIEVELKDIKTVVDEEDNTANYIIIPVPEFTRDANTEVTFTLKGVEYPDGFNYDEYVTATYTTEGYKSTIGIDSIYNKYSQQIFTIDGKVVTTPVKSNNLYIINGKKTLVK